jgi:hypothetical protein
MRLTIFFALLILSSQLYSQTPTFHQNVEPIIQANCTPCHKPGEAGPFSLITYDDVAKRASFIKKVVSSRYMPPWKPDNSYVHFANDRSLTDGQIDTIAKWIDNKMPEGKKLAKQDVKIIEGTSYKRKADLVLTQKNKYTIPGDNLDRFVIYKIPFELPDSANVEAIEFFSNNKKLIHHANFAIHPVDDSIDIQSPVEMINLTEQDRRLYDQYVPFRKKITYYGGWIPGASYEMYPQGFGWVMPKRGVILLTVHYSPLAKEEETFSGINLFFTKNPITRKVKVISFGSGGIGEQDIQPRFTFIPANKVSHYMLKVTNRSEDESLLYIWPHMHLLGKEFKAFAITPQEDTIPLVHIPSWDFRWQEIYRFKKMVHIPKGSVIQIEGDYDNTSDNPFNPNNPPEAVFSWGDMKTNQEMLTLIMVFLPYQAGDETLDLNYKTE